MYAIDSKAEATKKAAEAIIKESPVPPFNDIAKRLQDKGYTVQLGSTGLVPKSNHDGGVTQEAAKLQKNQISSFFRSNDGNSERNGYYIVQLVDINDKQVNYNYLRIPLTEFDKQIKSLLVNKKVQEYISVQKDTSALNR
jgi:membrane-associated protease RseP (regulator of RpoE activity)